ncbi:MAG: insulinase family protein [Bacteroidetes bacterium]|nr:MAG: insulinase family protein [Bacteroidota bacterium]
MDQETKIVRLSNGIRIAYVHVDSIVAHLGVTILAGSRYEEDHEEGLAHFLEHCIFKGTSKRRAFHVLSRLDSVGGELNAFTTKEEICIYASFMKEHLHRASDLISDIIQQATFPEKELIKEKEIVLDEINSYLDAPADRIFDEFEAQIFQNHPLGNNILGTKESVSGFTQQHLLEYVNKHFRAENMVISFVGSIPLNQLVRRLEKDFGTIQKGAGRPDPRTFENYRPSKKRSKEANFQAHVVIGSLAPGYRDDRRRGMTLLCNLLGGPALNARLILSIREKYGYSYNIEANYSPYADTGYWSVYFGTDQKYLKKTLSLVYRELRLLREKQLTPGQLKGAKDQLKGHLALSLENNSGLMQGLGKSLLLFDQIDTITEMYEEIDRITAEELQEIAQDYFDEAKISELIYEIS